VKKILVIEDDEPILNITTDLLNMQGYGVTGVTSGVVGVQRAREYVPDLVLSDLMMPELDGYGVLEILRSDPLTNTVPFIIMSAKAERAAIRRGMELGADDYLTKPFTSNELIAAVNCRLQKREIMEEISRKKLNDLRERITLALPHEIRTPLHSIIGFSDLLAAGVIDPKQVTDIGERLNRSAWRLWRLIENYLAYAQIELIKTSEEKIRTLLRDTTLCPESIIQDQTMQRAYEVNRQTDTTCELHSTTAIRISEANLRKIVAELVDNAFKFSRPGSPVQVSAWEEDHFYCIRIIDYGRGMSPDQIANIGAFTQFDRQINEQQGIGLGLSIAKDLTELHNGHFRVDSVVGKWTRVSIALPFAS
jgi:two-component system, sensor histidine kinase and response regulator